MQTAKLMQSGRGQVARLPKDCRLPGTDVLVQKLGDSVLLVPRTSAGKLFLMV